MTTREQKLIEEEEPSACFCADLGLFVYPNEACPWECPQQKLTPAEYAKKIQANMGDFDANF